MYLKDLIHDSCRFQDSELVVQDLSNLNVSRKSLSLNITEEPRTQLVFSILGLWPAKQAKHCPEAQPFCKVWHVQPDLVSEFEVYQVKAAGLGHSLGIACSGIA